VVDRRIKVSAINIGRLMKKYEYDKKEGKE
jgi:hypothetical protein